MSGICGIVANGGREVTEREIRQMTAHVERRGPEGTFVWTSGHVAFGFTRLATTPEAACEKMPLTHPETGCTLVGDIRLDNRAELASALGTRATIDKGDGRLVLEAYIRWGDACVERLLGDYAFAVWDPREKRLVCARDRMGVRQLVYAHDARRGFYFATDALALVKGANISDEIDREQVAEYLGVYLSKADYTRTWYTHVKRVPPGHRIALRFNQLEIERYWTLEPKAQLSLKSDQEYVEAFTDVFRSAVDCRLRSVRPAAAMLSGGLDSGAVVQMAAELKRSRGESRLVTISALSSDPASCLESGRILPRSKVFAVEPHFIEPADVERYLPDVEQAVWGSDDPCDFDRIMIGVVYAKARSLGVNVVLDGMAGDATFTQGPFTAELLRQGRWREWWSETRADNRFWDENTSILRRFVSDSARVLLPPPLRMLRNKVRLMGQHLSPAAGSQADAYFARACFGANRRGGGQERFPDRTPNFAEHRAASMTHTAIVEGRASYDRMAAQMGIETRDPFQDQRVIEFSLSLPLEQLRRDARQKWPLRARLNHACPEINAMIPGKEHVGWRYARAFLRASSLLHEAMPRAKIERYQAATPKAETGGRITSAGLGTFTHSSWRSVRLQRLALFLGGRSPEGYPVK